MPTVEKIRVEDHIGLAHAVASQFVNNSRLRVKDTEEYAEACLLLVQAVDSYVPEDGSFQTFAWTKMRNGLNDWLRRKKRKKRVGTFESNSNLTSVPEKLTEEPVSGDIVYQFLADNITETEQEKADKLVLIEVYLGGAKVQEVADRLGVSRIAIYQRLRRTIERLRAKHGPLLEQYEGV